MPMNVGRTYFIYFIFYLRKGYTWEIDLSLRKYSGLLSCWDWKTTVKGEVWHCQEPVRVREWNVAVWLRITPLGSCLNSWLPTGGAIWRRWEDAALLKVCHWRQGLRFQKCYHFLVCFLSPPWGSRCELSVVPATMSSATMPSATMSSVSHYRF